MTDPDILLPKSYFSKMVIDLFPKNRYKFDFHIDHMDNSI